MSVKAKGSDQQLEALIKIAKTQYKNAIYDSAIHYYSQALKLAKDQENDSIQIEVLTRMGTSYYYLSQIPKSDSALDLAIQKAHKVFGTEHLLTAQAYHYYSWNRSAQVNFNEGLKYTQRALDIRKSLLGNNDTLIAQSYNTVSLNLRSLGKYKEALNHYERAIEIWKLHPEVENIDKANTYYGLGWIKIAYGETNLALEYLLKALKIRSKLLHENHLQIANCYHLIARCYRDMNRYDDALKYAELSLKNKIERYGKKHQDLATTYSDIGATLFQLGNYQKAIEYYKISAAIYEDHFGKESLFLISVYSSLSNCYTKTKKTNALISYLDEAYRIAKLKLSADHPDFIQIYTLYAVYYETVGNYQSQIEFLYKALEVAESKFGENHRFYTKSLIGIAYFYQKHEKHEKSIEIYNDILKLKSKKSIVSNNSLSDCYAGLGNNYLDLDDPGKALDYYHKSLLILGHDTSYLSQLEFNPNIYDISSKLQAIGIIRKKGDVLLSIYENDTSKIAYLKMAINAYSHGINYIDALRSFYTTEEARVELFGLAKHMFAANIKAIWSLYLRTNKVSDLKKAFKVSEKSKAFSLLQAINHNKALKYSNIPDELLDHERKLKSQHSYLRDKLITARIKKNKVTERELEKKSFEVQRQLDSLVNQLEKTFPKYFELKYDKNLSSVDSIQENLAENTLFLEFFIGNDSIYSFGITRNKFKVFTTPKTQNFEQSIQNFRKSISNYSFIADSASFADNMYISHASNLYQYLLKKVIASFDDDIDHIVIVPDGQLGLINFEALLINAPKNGTPINYKKLDYLIHHYTVSIAPSATVLKQSNVSSNSKRTSTSKKLYAGFAPVYQPNFFESNFGNDYQIENFNIKGAIEEVEHVSEIFEGSTFVDRTTTESLFKEVSGEYRLLHLAMHGVISETSNEVKLLFSNDEDSENDGFLNIPEVYNLNLNADMVVLSACNSGFGKVQTGEGVLSLSRAFMYSGSPSVIMSLWALPDEMAPKLIGNFFNHLVNGQMKDEALKNAKIEYINTSEDKFYAHPYFWAGLVPIGNMAAIEFEHEEKMIKLISIISILLLICLILVIRKFR